MALEQEIRELEQRFADAPESRLFLPLADALHRAGELERAVQICSQGLESYPDFTSARVLLGQCLAELGRSAQAREVLEGVLSEDENNFEVLRTLGQIAADEGETASARKYFGRALELEPEDETLAASLDGLDGPAPESDSPVEEEEPSNGRGEVFITHTLGDLYRLQGHYQRAYEVYSHLLDQCPDDHSLTVKLEDVTARMQQQDVSTTAQETVTAEDGTVFEVEPAVEKTPEVVTVGDEAAERDWQVSDGELSMDRRIDRIFDVVLNDRESKSPEVLQTSGAGSFVNMFERWIKGLRLLEAE